MAYAGAMPSAPSSLPSDRLRAWYDAGEWFDFRRQHIFFRRSSHWDQVEKPVLLLIHGFPTAAFDWLPMWAGLAQRFRLIAPDLLGFGFSDKPAGHRYSIMEQADLIEALLAQHHVNHWHTLAHDYGDTVAQELLARQIERGGSNAHGMDSLVLLNGGLFAESHRPRLIQKLLLTRLGPWLARRLNRSRFGRAFSAVFGPDHQPSSSDLDEIWTLICHNSGQLRAPELLRYIPERKQYRARWVGALIESPVPIRFINGLLDPISGAHMVAHFRELIRNADVVELADLGHYPHWEAPDRVLAACSPWPS